MISFIRGKIIRRSPPSLILDVNGLGYEIFMSFDSFLKVSDKDYIELEILQVKKEEADLLYGFLTLEEKDFFKTILKVKGIGDKMIIQILSKISILELKKAIKLEDVNTLKKLPGLGPKTVSRIILELKDKIVFDLNKNKNWDDAISGLVVLGYDKKSAESELSLIFDNELTSAEDLIKRVLEKK